MTRLENYFKKNRKKLKLKLVHSVSVIEKTFVKIKHK